jgi:hypothetical protein
MLDTSRLESHLCFNGKLPSFVLYKQKDQSLPGMWLLRGFRGCSVRISAGTPAILTELFIDIRLSLEVTVAALPPLAINRFLPNPLQFINHHTVRRYAVWLLIAS